MDEEFPPSILCLMTYIKDIRSLHLDNICITEYLDFLDFYLNYSYFLDRLWEIHANDCSDLGIDCPLDISSEYAIDVISERFCVLSDGFNGGDGNRIWNERLWANHSFSFTKKDVLNAIFLLEDCKETNLVILSMFKTFHLLIC